MSMIGWCWFAWILLLSIVFVRQLREVLAMPEDWTIAASKSSEPVEGQDATDEEDR
jgi:hypothetical protein